MSQKSAFKSNFVFTFYIKNINSICASMQHISFNFIYLFFFPIEVLYPTSYLKSQLVFKMRGAMAKQLPIDLFDSEALKCLSVLSPFWQWHPGDFGPWINSVLFAFAWRLFVCPLLMSAGRGAWSLDDEGFPGKKQIFGGVRTSCRRGGSKAPAGIPTGHCSQVSRKKHKWFT